MSFHHPHLQQYNSRFRPDTLDITNPLAKDREGHQKTQTLFVKSIPPPDYQTHTKHSQKFANYQQLSCHYCCHHHYYKQPVQRQVEVETVNHPTEFTIEILDCISQVSNKDLDKSIDQWVDNQEITNVQSR